MSYHFVWISIKEEGGSIIMSNDISGNERPICEEDLPKAYPDLQQKMKELSAEQHRTAEACAFLKNLCASHQVSERAYAQYLTDLLPIYRTIEGFLQEHRQVPCLAPLCIPEIFREKKIVEDLKLFEKGGVIQSPPSVDYQNHLMHIGHHKPHLLIPHAYARYLGDLAGGQIIGRHVREIWPGKAAVLYYDFSDWQARYPDIKSPFGMMKIYSALLNSLPLTSEQYREILGEVSSPFEHAVAMLKAIEVMPGWDQIA
jgi:heme oxygenase